MNPGDEVWVRAEVVHTDNKDEVRVAIKAGDGVTDDKVYARTEDVSPSTGAQGEYSDLHEDLKRMADLVGTDRTVEPRRIVKQVSHKIARRDWSKMSKCQCHLSAVSPCPTHGSLRDHAKTLRLRLDTDRNSPQRAALYAALQAFESAYPNPDNHHPSLRIGDQILVAARLLDVGKTDVKVRTVGTHGEDEGWVKNASVFHTDGTPVEWGVQCTSLYERDDHIFRCSVYVNPANPLHNHRRGDLTWTTDEEAGTLVKTK